MNFKRIGFCVILLIALTSCSGAGGLPSPTSTAWVTPTSTIQSLPTATQATTPTLSLVTPSPPEAALVSQVMTSPDGQWDAESSFEYLRGTGYRVRLLVRKTGGAAEWVPVDYTQEGIGYFYPTLRHWSPDSRYFYYFNMPVGDGCGDFYPEEDEWVVLDVADGSPSTLPLPAGRGHTISPDGETMIYTSLTSPYSLHFRDIPTSTEQILLIPPPEDETQIVQAGGAVWAPDGNSLALSVAYGDSCEGKPLSFSVLRIDDLSNPVLHPLVEHSDKLLRLVGWETPDRILVKDWNNYSWWIDSQTGQAAPAPGSQGP